MIQGKQAGTDGSRRDLCSTLFWHDGYCTEALSWVFISHEVSC